MLEDYKKERKKGLKEVQKCKQEGRYPYLPVLSVQTNNLKKIGSTSIPLNLVLGTEQQSRSNSFSFHFHPIQEESSEFARKWISLFDAQVEHGIDDPIVVYEYKHFFYVREGNKRVSVFKALDARSIQAEVIRILDDTVEDTLQAFYDFYDLCPLYEIFFSKKEYYKELMEYTNHVNQDKWSKEDVSILRNRFAYFYSIFQKNLSHDPMQASDAFLMYLRVYNYSSLLSVDQETLKKRIQSIRKEVYFLSSQEKQIYRISSNEIKEPFFIKKKYYTQNHPLKIAFVYENYPDMKEWDLDHEMGRVYINHIFHEKVQTKAFSKEELPNIVGYDFVFSTSIFLMQKTILVAIKHPETKYLNCSIQSPSLSVSSYFGRMYEVKFLMGVLAGILSESNEIGYFQKPTTPICEINAFACGLSMTKPNARVHLFANIEHYSDFQVFVGSDLPDSYELPIFGLCKVYEDTPYNMATPIQNWGKYYEIMIRQFIQGSFYPSSIHNQALQDLWGFESDVIDIVLSNRIPKQVQELILSLKQNIIHNKINPFVGMYELEPTMDEIIKETKYHPNVIQEDLQ